MGQYHNIFPNPVANTLNISQASANTAYTIVNVTGQQVLSGMLNNKQIDVSSLSEGVYFLQLIDGTPLQMHKFVKISK